MTRLVMFDLDGTLVDSVPDIAAATALAMQDMGAPAPDESAVRTWVGNGVARLMARALSGDMAGDAPMSDVARAVDRFEAHYAGINGQRSSLYAAVDDVTRDLHVRGVRLACVTNKPGRFAHDLLRATGLAARMSVVVGGDTLRRCKPDALPLRHVATRLNIPLVKAVMVGDSTTDVRAARNAGCRVICVSYGYNHGEDIHTSGADVIIDSFSELPPALPGLPSTPIS